MHVVVIIQARMTSTRLPSKIMLPLGDKTVLGQVLTRCKKIKGVDEVCCAIPIGKEHDILIDEIKKYQCTVFRGSESNVLERYYQAAKVTKADIIMRITSDCPLINPEVCSQVLKRHIENNSQYTCNNMVPSWPHGYDCEVFGIEQLEDAMKYSALPEDYEHVTEWMRRSLKVDNFINPAGNQYHHRLTLDTMEDYIRLQKIFAESWSAEEIIELS
ncbi:glycosyltransferase family protein [Legionella pneumophila]|uniref:cytidylyltransferase domain-containing protein n=1 Tax=Legionella pneumophila TaxID=446 RepID=UPI00077730F3|nr:glycosyltransferase family protein [Legionella pneumophila]MCW8427743.1 glycosyltransferase family protein [Legionella pneumophila]HAT6811396.1 hypothetical protein [Legionella pneumophila]HAT8327067.1 hypothetical protein [Legionella pneumophila]HAT8333351.1 hypothetical protein [Legionella pneumophila]HAT8671923.1 hypothetical protein [Legionella pneumophila]